jgi:hypothetical protein
VFQKEQTKEARLVFRLHGEDNFGEIAPRTIVETEKEERTNMREETE